MNNKAFQEFIKIVKQAAEPELLSPQHPANQALGNTVTGVDVAERGVKALNTGITVASKVLPSSGMFNTALKAGRGLLGGGAKTLGRIAPPLAIAGTANDIRTFAQNPELATDNVNNTMENKGVLGRVWSGFKSPIHTVAAGMNNLGEVAKDAFNSVDNPNEYRDRQRLTNGFIPPQLNAGQLPFNGVNPINPNAANALMKRPAVPPAPSMLAAPPKQPVVPQGPLLAKTSSASWHYNILKYYDIVK
jgi:hypothetical protein